MQSSPLAASAVAARLGGHVPPVRRSYREPSHRQARAGFPVKDHRQEDEMSSVQLKNTQRSAPVWEEGTREQRVLN